MMAVTDIPTMKVIATPAIGPGTDGAGFDAGTGSAFSSNGGDGTMTIVKLVNGKYEAVDTVHHRARGAHHDGGPDHAPHLHAGRRVRSRAPKARTARRDGPP